MCENKECGRGLGRDRKRARRRLLKPVRPMGAWLAREVRGALRRGLCGRAPDFRCPCSAANALERLRFDVESRRSFGNGQDSA